MMDGCTGCLAKSDRINELKAENEKLEVILSQERDFIDDIKVELTQKDKQIEWLAEELAENYDEICEDGFIAVQEMIDNAKIIAEIFNKEKAIQSWIKASSEACSVPSPKVKVKASEQAIE